MSDEPAPRPIASIGVVAVLVGSLLFAINGTVSKVVLEAGLSSLRLVEIRCTAAAVAFFLIAALRSPRSLRVGIDELGFIVVYGITGIAFVQWLYLVAIARMPVSLALLIEYTAPLLVALWVRFARRGEVRPRVWLALLLSFGGLAVVAQVWQGFTLDGVGMLAAGAAAISLATYYLLGERGLGRRDPFSLSAWGFAASGAFWSLLLPWWTFPFDQMDDVVPIAGINAPVWLLVTWVVLLGTVAPFGLSLFGIGRIGATRTGLIGTAEPVLAGLVAWIAIGELLTGWQIIGAGVVLTGIVLAETSRPADPGADRNRGIGCVDEPPTAKIVP